MPAATAARRLLAVKCSRLFRLLPSVLYAFVVIAAVVDAVKIPLCKFQHNFKTPRLLKVCTMCPMFSSRKRALICMSVRARASQVLRVWAGTKYIMRVLGTFDKLPAFLHTATPLSWQLGVVVPLFRYWDFSQNFGNTRKSVRCCRVSLHFCSSFSPRRAWS